LDARWRALRQLRGLLHHNVAIDQSATMCRIEGRADRVVSGW
jgi:hypothetical protein